MVPCKNEAGNIFSVYRSILKINRDIELIYGDDNSSDFTRLQIFKLKKNNKKKNITIRYYLGPGINKAHNVKKGFDLATKDILIIHDADNTVDGSEIPKFIKKFKNNKSQLIIGTRLVKKIKKNAMKKPNYLGNIFFSILYSIIIKKKITDTLCGSKAIYRKDWLKIKKYWNKFLIEDHWGDFNLLLSAKINDFEIEEVPISYQERKYGETKMTKLPIQFIRMLIITIYGFFKIKFKKY